MEAKTYKEKLEEYLVTEAKESGLLSLDAQVDITPNADDQTEYEQMCKKLYEFLTVPNKQDVTQRKYV